MIWSKYNFLFYSKRYGYLLYNSLTNLFAEIDKETALNFRSIKSLTKKIKELKLNYSASVVTNGYLLTKEKIDTFHKLNIKSIHITIDGPKEIHNNRRPHITNKNSFDVIYNNMQKLIPYLKNKKIRLSVRVNVDKTNEDYYHKIYQKIRKDFKNIDVSIYSGIVKKTYGSCSSIDDILLDNQEQAAFNIKQYKQYGIKSPDFFPIRRNGECMARQIYGYLIDPKGDIYKCWTDIGNKTESIGNVSNNASINTSNLTRYLTGADVFDKEECQKCFFLPVCGGGCPHLAIKKMMGNFQINLCHIAKDNLEDFLEIYYEIKKEKQKIL